MKQGGVLSPHVNGVGQDEININLKTCLQKRVKRTNLHVSKI